MLVCDYAHAHTQTHEYMNATVSAHALTRNLKWRSTPRVVWHGTQINSMFMSCCQPRTVSSIIDAITLGPLTSWPLVLNHHEFQVGFHLCAAVLKQG